MKEASGSPFASAGSRLRRGIRQRKQPVQARAKATTDALLEATLQVLVREGYPKLTTTRVADRAGVSVGSLYQYFPDKRSLVTALKVRYFGLMVGAVGAALAADGSTDFEVVLRRALAALVGVKREHLALTKALRGPMADSEGLNFVRETLDQFVVLLVPHLSRLLPSAEAVEARASILVAALEGAISHAVFAAPDWLEQPWFVDELTLLAVGYVRGVALAARGSHLPRPRRTGSEPSQERRHATSK